MSKLVVRHDDEGIIQGFRYEANDDYTPGKNEVSPEDTSRSDLAGKRVDTGTGELISDETHGFTREEPIDRAKISGQTVEELQAAQKDGDVQAQVNHILDILGVDL